MPYLSLENARAFVQVLDPAPAIEIQQSIDQEMRISWSANAGRVRENGIMLRTDKAY